MCQANFHGRQGAWGHPHWHSRWGQHREGMRGNWFQPPVNVGELEDRYELHLVAPGRTKQDFQLKVQGDLLTISAQAREESDIAQATKWTRQEFRTVSFERQFQLNEKIDAEGITASYSDGVLVVTLPKFANAHTPARDVFVA